MLLKLCDVCLTEAGYSVHSCGVYLIRQWSGKDTGRWSLREFIYIVLLLCFWAWISKRVLTGWNVKGASKVVQRVSEQGLWVVVIRISIGTLCPIEMPVLEA